MITTKAKLVAPAADVEFANQIKETSKSMAEAIRRCQKEWPGTENRGRVARALNIRYQWVRNVELTPIKKS